MSHVVDIDLEIKDLSCLKEAAKLLGLNLVQKSTYKWFGRHVGDYPLPKGFSKEDLGKCDYALQIPDNPEAYEVGVVKRKDGSGYQLIWDFWNGGFGLVEKIGPEAKKLKQEYSVALAIKHQRRKGLRVSRYSDEKGNVFVKGIGR